MLTEEQRYLQKKNDNYRRTMTLTEEQYLQKRNDTEEQ